MLTVSPVSAASCRHTGRASVTRSSRAVVAPASRRFPTPSRYSPPVPVLLDQAVRLRGGEQSERGGLVHAEPAAISVTPASPSRASISRIVSARSTDCTNAAAACDSSTAVMRAPYPFVAHGAPAVGATHREAEVLSTLTPL